jgi:hypothetical protein
MLTVPAASNQNAISALEPEKNFSASELRKLLSKNPIRIRIIPIAIPVTESFIFTRPDYPMSAQGLEGRFLPYIKWGPAYGGMRVNVR